MAVVLDPSPQPFDLDAILQEFNVGNTSEVLNKKQDDSVVARVRESLGLGRSLFRRKETEEKDDEERLAEHDDVDGTRMSGNDSGIDKSSKPRKRIVDSDDEENLPIVRPSTPHSSLTQSASGNNSTDDELQPRGPYHSDSDDDVFSAETFLNDFRKARLEALSAKVAAKTLTENEVESAASERSQSPIRSPTHSVSPSGRKPKVRKASKKALDEMHRETQRMARNMALRPEVKVSKKIEMSTIFAKFGFNPNKATETTQDEQLPTVDPPTVAITEAQTSSIEEPSKMSIDPVPMRHATPSLDDSDSDDSLPSPSKIALFLPQKHEKPPFSPDIVTSPRKVHFALPPPSASDSDSDVEILQPPNLLSTHAATPDRKRIKRTVLIRSLANLKSPVQHRSPGRMTQRELDLTLSREAAIQAKRKREERRAELKSLGIDVEKVVEKRDLLEEAREEARRVREEEGGEESDEEYFDEEENDDGDGDDEESVGDGQSGEDEEDVMEEGSGEDEMDESDVEDVSMEDAPMKRKSRMVQVLSDDEDDAIDLQPSVIPESIIGSQPKIQQLSQVLPTDDLSLTQFFHPTQMSGSTELSTSMTKTQPQSEGSGTGMTQFFTSTAMDDDIPTSGEDEAHNRMEILRQKAAHGVTILGEESIGFPGLIDGPASMPVDNSPVLEPEESPIRRRILKRRSNLKSSNHVIPETSEEFIKSRKEFIEEQAEESEDDYAAWGSGDESENENMDGVVDGLIDDDTKIKKNTEQEVARLYMEGELERDEKFVHGLMHDLQNGGLRRRRGGGLEMGDWDSDDEDEDAEERRRRWELRREEMKRRMLEDENLGKLAANPKTQAFLNAISSTALNFDDEPDFLGEGEIIEDRRAGTAARNLPNTLPLGDSQYHSQEQISQSSAEIQVPATSSADLPRHERDRIIIEELTQIEDSQPIIPDDLSLSEASDSEFEEKEPSSFVTEKVYTGFVDRAAQKRAARTISESANRFAFKAVNSSSPARVKRTAVSVIEADDESTRKKIMKEVVESKSIKRKTWGTARGRGAVTFRSSAARGKENSGEQIKKKGNGDAEKRRRDMLILMDSQNSFC